VHTLTILPPVLCEFYVHEKRAQTVKALPMLWENVVKKVQASSLLKIFKAVEFRWEKIGSARRLLTSIH
jgi:hypothetical protein